MGAAMLAAIGFVPAAMAGAQAGSPPATQASPQAGAQGKEAPALQLNTLGQNPKPADPFPPANLKFFTAQSPTVAEVNAFLKTLWGYDPNRLWRVEAIQATASPNVSKVVVFVSENTPNAKVQTSAFFVLPDGKHIVAGDSISPFGATPFVETRKLLEAKADGPARGAQGKQLLLVEFADLQCPHCKDAQPMMNNLVRDFPNARVVYQSFPIVDLHPYAFKAAAYGLCVAKQKQEAFFPYAQAVYDTQGGLTEESGDETLRNAVTKAGLTPGPIDICAASQATKDEVTASIKLAQEVGVDQTPMLAVNGRLLPLTQLPYETLKQLVSFQASLDGVGSAAAPTK